MRVSVVMATFNGAGHVAGQVTSILAQSRRPDEIVIADDGSTDETVAIVTELLSAVSGVQVVMLPVGDRLGVAANFERGLRAATGDVIALSDQDDVWHPDRLSVALAAFPDTVLLQHADAVIVGEDGSPLGFRLFEALVVGGRELAEIDAGRGFELYLRRNLATGAVTILRRELRDTALPIPEGWIHDEWLTIVAAALGAVQILESPLIDYRQHGANQIGVTRPTLRYRIRRMLQPRGSRYHRLAARAAVLERRFTELDVSPAVRAAVAEKREFEEARAAYPVGRLARVAPLIRQVRAGRYAKLSSQRTLDLVRDLLQPASSRRVKRSVRDR